MEKTANYTEAQVAQIVKSYQEGIAVEQIAQSVGKSVRSVIGKLSREGVYQAKAKAAGTGRVTKADLINDLEDSFGLVRGSLETLNKASMEHLQTLISKMS